MTPEDERVTEDTLRRVQDARGLLQDLGHGLYVHAAEDSEQALGDLDTIVCDERWLLAALDHIAHRSGAAGVDGVSPRHLGVADWGPFVEGLARDLRSGEYRPRPARAHYIGRGPRKRLGAISTLRDRVVQTSVRMVLDPISGARASDGSFGYRVGRGPHAAVVEFYNLARSSGEGAVCLRTDVKDAFRSVDHVLLFRELRALTDDRALVRRIKSLLRAGLVLRGRTTATRSGLALGSALSPVLFNIAMGPLDRFLEDQGVGFVRYADDLSVVVEGGAADARDLLLRLDAFARQRLHLELSPEKTTISSLDQGVDLLGYRVTYDRSRYQVEVHPGQRGLAALHAQAAEVFATCSSVGQLVERMNGIIRRWQSYFVLDEDLANAVFAVLDRFAPAVNWTVGINDRGAIRLREPKGLDLPITADREGHTSSRMDPESSNKEERGPTRTGKAT